MSLSASTTKKCWKEIFPLQSQERALWTYNFYAVGWTVFLTEKRVLHRDGKGRLSSGLRRTWQETVVINMLGPAFSLDKIHVRSSRLSCYLYQTLTAGITANTSLINCITLVLLKTGCWRDMLYGNSDWSWPSNIYSLIALNISNSHRVTFDPGLWFPSMLRRNWQDGEAVNLSGSDSRFPRGYHNHLFFGPNSAFKNE